jgi:metallo-beta-lactamase family protein
VDTLIIGGPFSHARHPMFADAQQHLAERISAVHARGGHMIVPAASVGPVHEFIRTVQKLFRRGKIPAMPIWLDTPTPVDPGTVLRLHPEALAQPDRAYDGNGGAFDQSLLHFASTDDDRAALDEHHGPAIIIAPSEMGDSGRAAHHLRRCLPDARHDVVLLAFPEEGSVSEHLHAMPAEVTIEGEVVPVQATITPMPAYSGHADAEEWRGWIRSLEGPIKRAFVVHGDDLAVAVMVTILREEGVRDVIVPREGESFAF